MKVSITSTDGHSMVYTEEKRANTWNRLTERLVENESLFTVYDGQRLIVEPRPTVTLAYDKDQMAARPVTDEVKRKMDEDRTLSANEAELAAEEEAEKRRHAVIKEAQERIAASRQGTTKDAPVQDQGKSTEPTGNEAARGVEKAGLSTGVQQSGGIPPTDTGGAPKPASETKEPSKSTAFTSAGSKENQGQGNVPGVRSSKDLPK